MDYSDKWLGLAGGGGGFSVIGGVGVYQLDLYNMNGGAVPMRVLSVGKRLGVTLQAEVAHAVCLLTGVRSPDDFTSIKSNGLDWALSFGIKADSLLKTGGAAAKAIMGVAVHGGNWAAHETAKKAVQGLMGDFSMSPKEPSFVLLPTPAALAIGAGIYYEWQELTKVGSDLAWSYAPPSWRVEMYGAKLVLRMAGIPEADGTRINFRIRIKGWGTDDTILFTGPGKTKSYNLTGTVYSGSLYDLNSKGQGWDGFDLSAYQPVGTATSGFFGVDKTTDVAVEENLEIGVSVCKGQINLYRWESSRYAKVRTDAKGRLSYNAFHSWGD